MSPLAIDLLLLLRGAGDYGLALELLVSDLRRGRHRGLSTPQTETALRDLADKSYAAAYLSPLGVKRWRITGLGASALDEEGL